MWSVADSGPWKEENSRPAADHAGDRTVPASVPGPCRPSIPDEFIPRHVAIVMDGNGRWANQRGLPRIEGHKAGEPALLDVVAGAIELGIKYVTRVRLLHGELAAVPGGSPLPDGF